MKAGIMQPYLFPYIGYWQLIQAADIFVVLDDVNFIKRGYINRNHILINGKRQRFTIPVKSATQNRLICDTEFAFTEKIRKDFLQTIYMAYHKAPMFPVVNPLIEKIIRNQTLNLTDFITDSLVKICEYLGIATKIIRSSELIKNKGAVSEERILEICKVLQADTYINPCGGRHLYKKSDFIREGIMLLFLDPTMQEIIYKQFDNEFVPSLSIIDIMMFNPVRTIQEFLMKYKLNE